MGSEMCIRDRGVAPWRLQVLQVPSPRFLTYTTTILVTHQSEVSLTLLSAPSPATSLSVCGAHARAAQDTPLDEPRPPPVWHYVVRIILPLPPWTRLPNACSPTCELHAVASGRTYRSATRALPVQPPFASLTSFALTSEHCRSPSVPAIPWDRRADSRACSSARRRERLPHRQLPPGARTMCYRRGLLSGDLLAFSF